MGDAIEQFRDALRGRGIIPPDGLIADGRLHRCDVDAGKRGKGDATYLLYVDGYPAGGFENWRDGLGWQAWKADTGRAFTEQERLAHRERMEAASKHRDADRIARQADAATRAAAIWGKSKSGPHPYLERKGIEAHGARIYNGALVVRVRNAAGALQSLQFIDAEGDKKFLTGGKVEGCYFSIGGKPGKILCIAEGFATGASIHHATGYPVAVAFDAGNLGAVARVLRAKLPDVRLIVCADDDYQTEGNPGREKAIAAARAVRGFVALPVFADGIKRGTDFNDLHKAEGPDAVRACIEAAEPIEAPEEPSNTLPYVELLRGDSIKPEAVSWLWNEYLVAGKINIIAGAPTTGKTTLALAMAATVTNGGRWPDGTKATPGDVIIWSGEDANADVLIPRLLACGADMSRVRIVGRVREGNEMRPFDPARDLAELRRAMLDGGNEWKLLIIDSIVSATSGDSHKNAEVRKGLEPLGALADETGCAILGIAHFTKGTTGREPLERVSGSLAFGAVPRMVLATAKRDKEHGGKRILTRAKSNLGPDGGGFVYDIEQTETPGYPGIFASHVLWCESLEGTAREILADAETQPDYADGGALADAKSFLADLLADGPVSSKQVYADADGAGHTRPTIRRAQKALGIEATKEGMKSGWVWRLPAGGTPNSRRRSTNSEDAQQNDVSTFGKSEHLRTDEGAEIEGVL